MIALSQWQSTRLASHTVPQGGSLEDGLPDRLTQIDRRLAVLPSRYIWPRCVQLFFFVGVEKIVVLRSYICRNHIDDLNSLGTMTKSASCIVAEMGFRVPVSALFGTAVLVQEGLREKHKFLLHV